MPGNRLPRTRADGVGTLLMFAVRNIFARPTVWPNIREPGAQGAVPAELRHAASPLDFLVRRRRQGVTSATSRAEPGFESVLTAPAAEPFGANRASLLNASDWRPAAADVAFGSLVGRVGSNGRETVGVRRPRSCAGAGAARGHGATALTRPPPAPRALSLLAADLRSASPAAGADRDARARRP